MTTYQRIEIVVFECLTKSAVDESGRRQRQPVAIAHHGRFRRAAVSRISVAHLPGPRKVGATDFTAKLVDNDVERPVAYVARDLFVGQVRGELRELACLVC